MSEFSVFLMVPLHLFTPIPYGICGWKAITCSEILKKFCGLLSLAHGSDLFPSAVCTSVYFAYLSLHRTVFFHMTLVPSERVEFMLWIHQLNACLVPSTGNTKSTAGSLDIECMTRPRLKFLYLDSY